MADETIEQVSAHRPGRRVPVMGGAANVIVRPWTMKQRAELKPLLAAVVSRIAPSDATSPSFSLPSLMLAAEDELCEIARATAEMPTGVSWDDLHWEDLPTIIQAIWETSIVTIAGGGLAGKVMSLLAGAMRTVAVSQQVQAAQQALKNGSAHPMSSQPSSEPRPN